MRISTERRVEATGRDGGRDFWQADNLVLVVLKIEVSGGRTSGLIEKVMRLPLKLLFPFGCGPPSILLLSEVLLVHVWMQS